MHPAALLAEIREEPRLTRVLALAHKLGDAIEAGAEVGPGAAGGSEVPAVEEELAILLASDDDALAIAAVHAIARIPGSAMDIVLEAALRDRRTFIRSHAAWAWARRPYRESVLADLIGFVGRGGLPGMLAQLTLETWAPVAGDRIGRRISEALTASAPGARAPRASPTGSAAWADADVAPGVAAAPASDPTIRRRLVEALGLLGTEAARDAALRIAEDPREPLAVRDAAISALGDGDANPQHICALKALRESAVGQLRVSADLALADLDGRASRSRAPHEAAAADSGIAVAQVFLGADIDPQLRRVGSGNNGGIATLLVRLGDALVHPSLHAQRVGTDAAGVERVLTISRASDTTSGPVRGGNSGAFASAGARGEAAPPHEYAQVRLAVDAPSSEDSWSNYVSARRAIERALRQHAPFDAIHLRMADVGTLAGWHAARRLGIRVVFTAAPDPHALIESMDQAGSLTRRNFGERDEAERLWFRAWLVRELAQRADHAVLMPRERLASDLERLVGVDIEARPSQFSPIAEGIDLTVVNDALAEGRRAAGRGQLSEEIAELRELLSRLPAERRGLPLLITIGRVHRVKGTAALVEAWSAPEVRERCNLLIVGGGLSRPSPEEAEQLDAIDRIIPREQQASAGLLLAGHRPHSTAARWLAVARYGLPGFATPRGAYVCASAKEEFGLAILEASATGLFVIAPQRGGPATYLEHGRTGLLVDTSSSAELRRSLGEALDAAAQPASEERADHAYTVVSERFSIATMASRLAHVYASLATGRERGVAHASRSAAPAASEHSRLDPSAPVASLFPTLRASPSAPESAPAPRTQESLA
ncbi:glycosyltransferase family 4 protein [Leucobacter sp. USHLN153]|uniref:glycosyltransferase family 4 protein n=1 Tax=Leucobacter sp. USHLN153 TaxID=3081268 RepID=UPI0030158BE7